MNAEAVQALIEQQIGEAWDTTNLHGVVLQESLVRPTQIDVIERRVRDGRTFDRLVQVWLVLIEDPKERSGYRIVASSDGSMFGLATEGFPSDQHLILCGWYGDFLTTFSGM